VSYRIGCYVLGLILRLVLLLRATLTVYPRTFTLSSGSSRGRPEATPAPFGARPPGAYGPSPASRGGAPPGRRAPARGVDVKPLAAGGPGGPEKAQNSPKWAIMAKNPFFRHFWRKWPFLANFPEKAPVATGLKYRKNPKNGDFPKMGLKIRVSGTPRGLLLHQPLAAGPCPRISRGSGACPGQGGSGKGPPRGPCRSRGPRGPSRPGPGTGPRREGLM